MPRYRMTPPVRGRCPASRNAERALTLLDSTNLEDLVVKNEGVVVGLW